MFTNIVSLYSSQILIDSIFLENAIIHFGLIHNYPGGAIQIIGSIALVCCLSSVPVINQRFLSLICAMNFCGNYVVMNCHDIDRSKYVLPLLYHLNYYIVTFN